MKMKQTTFFTALAFAIALSSAATARDQIRIVGSSTVYPFSSAAAERFGKAGKFKTPIVESTGTGGGIKLFCAGVGPEHPDLANASREIKSSEKEQCAKNGVKNVVEVTIGFDGIVLANSIKGPKFNLTKEHIFLALAREVPKDGKLVPNFYKNWQEVDASLPNEPIEVLGPPPTSGTRDAFAELVMEKACESFPEFAAKYTDEKERKKLCQLVREDGKYVDAGENDNLIVQKLVANPLALGIFGFSFLEENASTVQGSTIGGVEPTFDNIAAGTYGVSRSLHVYVKGEHLGVIPGIKEYLAEMTGEGAIGDEGYLSYIGLIPLPKEGRDKTHQTVTSLK